MQMKKKLLIAIPIAAVLAISTGVGVAFANNGDNSVNPLAISDNTTTTFPCPAGASNGAGYCGQYNNGMMGQAQGAVTQFVANMLGTTSADLEAQLKSGKTLAEIADANGISQDQLVQSLMAPMKDQMALMLKYGFMTQTQVDTMTQQMPAMLTLAVNSKLNSPETWDLMQSMMQQYGGGMMGGWGNSQSTLTPNSQPSGATNSPRSGFRGMMGRW